jgi:NAD(P)-dependent dehydrogenase (short-subunit alcohol dehydrogenase family)
LIAGGLGGIGRVLASWFIEHGAKNLIVLSRSASKHEDAPVLLEEAQAVNCRLVICDCDLSDEQSFVSLMQELYETGLPPVRGAINAAMVLNDSVIETMTFERWDKSARTKIDGSRNLHKHLPDMKFFIMLSSASGFAGNSSQSNYAAGNTYQDALARHRTAQGLPAVCYDLGAVDTVGFLAKQADMGNEKLRAFMDKVAFGSIDEHVVLRMVEAGIRDPMRKSLSDCQIVVGPNLFAFASGSAAVRERRFGTLRITSQRSLDNTGAATSGSNMTASLIADLKATTTVADATKVILELFMPKLADMFSISQSDMDPRLPLSSYGVDSLSAVELRNWISGTIHVKVSVFEILQTPSLLEFATLLAGKSEYVNVQDSVSK